MLVFAASLAALAVAGAVVLLAVAAYLRAEAARETLSAVEKRLAVIEKQLGIARPVAVPRAVAELEAAQPAGPEATSLEERFALVWLARIGAVILVLGAMFFFFYGPRGGAEGAGRFGAAVLCGVAALVFAEVNRKRARPLFNQAVLGLGVMVLEFAAIAGHRLYQLTSPATALAGAAAVFAVGCVLAMRHGTQVPLVIPFAGALAAPALVWRDAPDLVIFACVLAVSAGALAVAVRSGFRIALWLVPPAGLAALAPWYVKSFDARAGGPHQLLAGRLLPLALAVALAGAWTLAHLRARRPGREALLPAQFLVLALSLAHVPIAALAYDQPPLLTAAFACFALAAAYLLRAGSPLMLVPPLATGFVILLGVIHARAPIPTLAPLTVWGAAYALGLLRPAGKLPLALTGAAGGAYLVLAGALLAPHHWRAFGLVTVLWSVAYAYLAMARRAPLLLAATGLFSFVALCGAAVPLAKSGDPVLLLVCGAWVLVHFGGLAFRIRSQHETPELAHVATASGAGVAYGLLVLFLAPDLPLLRGALAAASACCHIVLGGMLLGRSPWLGNGLQAVAVGLFGIAAMHALPGALSTLAWAVLATLLVDAGFRRRSRLLRLLGLGLFGAVIARVAVWDVWHVQRPYEVAVLLAVGALILGASYLYARLGARLAEVMRDGRAVTTVLRGAPPPAEGTAARARQDGGR